MPSRVAFKELSGSVLNTIAYHQYNQWPLPDHADENGDFDPRLARAARIQPEERDDDDNNDFTPATFRPYGLPPRTLTTSSNLPSPFSSSEFQQDMEIHEDPREEFEEEHRLMSQFVLRNGGGAIAPPTRTELINDVRTMFHDIDHQLGAPRQLRLIKRICAEMDDILAFTGRVRRNEESQTFEIGNIDELLALVRGRAPWYEEGGIPFSRTPSEESEQIFVQWRYHQLLRADLEWCVGNRGTAVDIYELVRREWALREDRPIAEWLLDDEYSYDDLRSLMFYLREMSTFVIASHWRKLTPTVEFVENCLDPAVQGRRSRGGDQETEQGVWI